MVELQVVKKLELDPDCDTGTGVDVNTGVNVDGVVSDDVDPVVTEACAIVKDEEHNAQKNSEE